MTKVPDSLKGSPHVKYLEVAIDAALAAGEVIKGSFKGPKMVEEKLNHADLVTATDKAAEDLIFGRIRAAFPDHAFIGEESAAAAGGTAALGDTPTWMVDPLDGTTNFVHGFPFVCTSIALVVGRRVVVGVVYNPVLGELFAAAAGGGACLNGVPLATSAATDLAGALMGTEVGTARDEETVESTFGRIRTLTSKMRSVRCGGSCALGLCGVAAGRLDAFYEINFGGCWDSAAGALIVSEAGGAVLDPAGGPWDVMSRRVLAAGTRQLGEAVAAVLAGCRLSSREPGPPAPGGVVSLERQEAEAEAEAEAAAEAAKQE